MTTDLALEFLIVTLSHASEIGALIQNARAQNRDVSEAELTALHGKYDTARAALIAEIAKQGGVT